VAVKDAIATHFAYGGQREGLEYTDILEKYRALSIHINGPIFEGTVAA